jgi:hypothetical protein
MLFVSGHRGPLFGGQLWHTVLEHDGELSEGLVQANPSKSLAQSISENHCGRVTTAHSRVVGSEFRRNTYHVFAEISRLATNQTRYRIIPNRTVIPPGVDSIKSDHHLMVVTRFNLFLHTPRTNAHVGCLPS